MTAHDTIFAVTLSLILAMGSTADAQRVPPSGMVDDKIEPAVKRHVAKTLTFRHQIHQNPELGNCEYETAKLVENHLRALGIEVLCWFSVKMTARLDVNATPGACAVYCW